MAQNDAFTVQQEEYLKKLNATSAFFSNMFKRFESDDRDMIMEHVNGSPKDFFDLPAQKQLEQIAAWKNEKKSKGATTTQLEKKEVAAETNSSFDSNLMFQRMLLPDITAEFFNFQIGPDTPFDGLIEKVAEHFKKQRDQFIIPIAKLIDCDEGTMLQAEKMALKKFFANPFELVACSEKEGGVSIQMNTLSTFFTAAYQRHLFRFTVDKNDQEATGVMALKRDEIINTVSVKISQRSGLPLEHMKSTMGNIFWSIMNDIRLQILSKIG